MKISLIGLGIVALIFSINLIFPGLREVQSTPRFPLFALAAKLPQTNVEDNGKELDPIFLHQHSDQGELNHGVRKFPLLSCLFSPHAKPLYRVASATFETASLSFTLLKDLFLTYGQLRI